MSENERLREVMKEVSDALDIALGDTDPDFPEDMTDDDIRDEDPVFWACKTINKALDAEPETCKRTLTRKMNTVWLSPCTHADNDVTVYCEHCGLKLEVQE